MVNSRLKTALFSCQLYGNDAVEVVPEEQGIHIPGLLAGGEVALPRLKKMSALKIA
jgi:hypothetical protein